MIKMKNVEFRYNEEGKASSCRVRISRGYDSNGKQRNAYTRSLKFDMSMTEKQKEKAAVEFRDECKRECSLFGIAYSNIKLSEFTKKYLETAKNTLAPTTYRRAQQVIKDFIIPALGHIKLHELNSSHIQQFVEQLENTPKLDKHNNPTNEKISQSTVKRNLAVLQAILKLAVKQGLIQFNPANAERLTLPKVQKPKIEIFTKQEAVRMLECLENESLQFQVLIQLAIFTGARRGELVALKFSDIDFENRKITIERSAYKIRGEPIKIKPPKDYETRTVTVNQSSVDLLKLLKAEKIEQAQRLGTQWVDENWVFTQWNGKIMNIDTPTVQFSKFLKKYGFQHRKFHSLRHTSATLLLYNGVNIKQVQGRLGHSNIETTNKYLHLIEEADVDAADKLDLLLSPKKNNAVEILKGENKNRQSNIS